AIRTEVRARGSRRAVDNWPFEDKTDQRLPFIVFTKDCAWNVGDFAAEFRHVVDAPSHNHIDGKTSFNGVGIAKLSLFDLATALQGLVINLNAPSLGVPSEFLDSVFESADAASRQKHPAQWRNALGCIGLLGQNGPQLQRTILGFILGRLQRDFSEANFQPCDASGNGTAPR